jgi:hypothetical protein
MVETNSGDDTILHVVTPLDFFVVLTRQRWDLITQIKHPVMKGREAAIQGALTKPDEIRRSRSDPEVLLFYQIEQPGRWTCVVVRRRDVAGFVITAYPTDAIKEGTRIWPR